MAEAVRFAAVQAVEKTMEHRTGTCCLFAAVQAVEKMTPRISPVSGLFAAVQAVEKLHASGSVKPPRVCRRAGG